MIQYCNMTLDVHLRGDERLVENKTTNTWRKISGSVHLINLVNKVILLKANIDTILNSSQSLSLLLARSLTRSLSPSHKYRLASTVWVLKYSFLFSQPNTASSNTCVIHIKFETNHSAYLNL